MMAVDGAGGSHHDRQMRGFFMTVVGVVGLVPGCFDAAVGDAVLACAEAADCPEPLFCDGGRCQRGSAGDVTPPGVTGGSARLAETSIRPGDTTALSFVPTEALGESPRFRGDDVTFSDLEDNDGTFTVDVTARSGAGDGAHDLSAILVDLANNTSQPVFLATLLIDGTAPTLENSSVPATVGPGVALVVGGAAGEALASAECTFSPITSETLTVVAADISGSDFSCTGPAFAAADTAVQVKVQLIDPAGNSANVTLGSVAVAFLQ